MITNNDVLSIAKLLSENSAAGLDDWVDAQEKVLVKAFISYFEKTVKSFDKQKFIKVAGWSEDEL
jgi:hypothetical protein